METLWFLARKQLRPAVPACRAFSFLDDVVDELGSRQEVEYLHTILKDKEGTSADRQLRTYRNVIKEGASEQEALFAVVDRLVEETLEGTES